ncbi:MAG: FHA domain-containing protein, partial [Planctomycetia bacterium]|nr:FHA domain-containing protein [Planctomycetia bacterium]
MLLVAGRPGPSFPLDPSTDNVLGRSPAALVVLADRLASRAHAAVSFDAAQGRWTLRDLGSRNGTWLDGLQVATAALEGGAVIRVGTSEFLFHVQADPADVANAGGRIVRRGPPGRFEAAALRRTGTDDARWPMLVYQASIRMLAATSPHEIVATTLELVVEFSAASTCGWFRIGEQADLEPVCVVPPGSNLVLQLDEAGADAVACAGEAAWCGPAPDTRAGADTDFDVGCVPLLDGGRPHAVLAISAAGGVMRDAGPVVFFGAMLLLPAAGVPMLAFTIPAGEAYAPQLGLTGVLGLTLVILALNLALIYWLARFALRPVLLGLMKRYGYSVPRVTPENALTVILVVRLTGSPYAVQGYILGLAETPFRIYMIASWLCVLPWSAGAVVLGKGIMNGNFKLVGIGLAVLAVAVVAVQ